MIMHDHSQGEFIVARAAAKKIEKKAETSTTLLEAAKKVLRQNGYAGGV